MSINIAILDDEDDILYSLSSLMLSCGYKTFTYKKGADLLKNLINCRIQIVFLDINLGETLTGIDYLNEIKKITPDVKVIVISGNADIRTAVDAVKKGAADFIEKPLHSDEVMGVIESAVDGITIKKERNRLLDDLLGKYEITGGSKSIEDVKNLIGKYAPLNETVLITGENGTGKELVAANLHYLSKRKSEKYFKVNIPSLPENLIESELFGYKKGAFSGAVQDRDGIFLSADHSSLFIDEIGEMKYDLQAKLLRVIQEKEFIPLGMNSPLQTDVRLIFATNKNLNKEVLNGSFREDLFYRIATLEIHIPPLRERREDIKPITERIIKEFVSENNYQMKIVSPDGFDKLYNYNFPGNIRELKNIIVRAVINSGNGECISERDIQFDERRSAGAIGGYTVLPVESAFEETCFLNEKKRQLEKMYIDTQLKKFNNDMHITAEKLGILVNNLYRKLR